MGAKEAANEVQAALDWATVRSPIDGTVIDKKISAGDMVTPGQPLVTLFDPKHMQLVASVRLVDAKVSIDLKRILRMPTSLHSKVSMRCMEVKNIETFDPLKETVPKFVSERKVKKRS